MEEEKITKNILIPISIKDHEFLREKGINLSRLGKIMFRDYCEQERMKNILISEHNKKREELLNAVQQPDREEEEIID